jgi:hypothetical protein
MAVHMQNLLESGGSRSVPFPRGKIQLRRNHVEMSRCSGLADLAPCHVRTQHAPRSHRVAHAGGLVSVTCRKKFDDLLNYFMT